MSHFTKSFLPCVSLSTILSLGACASEPRFEQTAQFSQASEDEIRTTMMVVELAYLASISMPLIAAIDAGFSDNGCPQITENGIIGNGCVTSGGSRYDGSFEFVESGVEGFTSVIYRDFRWTADAELSIHLDGSLVFTQESDETVRYDLDMAVAAKQEIGQELVRGEAAMSAVCNVLERGTARCSLEPGAAAKVDGVGGFTMEGFHQLGFPSGESNENNASDVILQGADSLHFEYDGSTDCFTYTIEGREPHNDCAEE